MELSVKNLEPSGWNAEPSCSVDIRNDSCSNQRLKCLGALIKM